MAITWADVTAFDTTATTVSAVAQTTILALVNARDLGVILDDVGDSGIDGPQTKLARIFLALHLVLGTMTSGGAAGPVTSETGGGLAVTYANLATTRGYSSTAYGREYARMIGTSLARTWVLL